MRNFVLLHPVSLPHFCIVEERPSHSVILQLMRKYLLIAITMLFCTLAQAQGWERAYGGGGQDAANAVAVTPDGGYILTGYYNLNSRISLIKVDADGNQQFAKYYNVTNGEGTGVVVTPDGGFVVCGYNSQNIYLFKTDAFGNLQWSKSYGNNLYEKGLGLVRLSDGGFAIVAKRNNGSGNQHSMMVLRTDAAGNQLWLNTFMSKATNPENGASIALASNGDIIASCESKIGTGSIDIYVTRINSASGQKIWENTFALNAPGMPGDDEPYAIQVAPNGKLLVAGKTTTQNGAFLAEIAGDGSALEWSQFFPTVAQFNDIVVANDGNFFVAGRREIGVLDDLTIVKTNDQGQVIWQASAGRSGADYGNAVVAANDGGAVIAGVSEDFIGTSVEAKAFLVKTDAEGFILTSYLEGNIFRDNNLNCQKDAGDTNLKDWIVLVQKQDFIRYAVSRPDGSFRIAVDTGHYDIKLVTPNDNWESCTPTLSTFVPDFYDTVAVSIPVQPKASCPRNEIDVATPILRRCAENTYTFRYCNSGTINSAGTYVDVKFDRFMQVLGSSINGTALGENTYRYPIGNLQNGQCNSFTVNVFLQCDSTVAEQTHCVTAHIYPDTFCQTTPNWDGAFIVAKAICDGDSIKMVIINDGIGDMGTPLGYVIAQDVLMLTAPPGSPDALKFQLDAGKDSIVYATPADGKTYRIIAEQSAGYPGESYPTAAVEGCISDTSSNDISIGFYTMFPEDDADAFVSTDCQQSSESDYNPLYLKRGHPKGYDEPHFVSPQTDFDYLIQFRNTGPTTVQEVIVRDTLSEYLDAGSVRPGAASHPYQFDIYGNGIVEFRLSNLNLPPGSSASEGFVRFRVSQKPNLPCETVILNRAAIYFDFNAPFMTGETYHTVCEPDSFLIITESKEVFVPGATVKVYPNPAYDYANFELTGVQARDYTLQLFDLQGRLILNQTGTQPNFQIWRHHLSEGNYFYRLAANGRPVASGKLVLLARW